MVAFTRPGELFELVIFTRNQSEIENCANDGAEILAQQMSQMCDIILDNAMSTSIAYPCRHLRREIDILIIIVK
jgi:hypothetical protein